MLRLLVALLALAGTLAAPALADPVTLVPGVTYDRQLELTPHGPVVLHVVTAPPPGGLVSLQAALPDDAISGRETLTSLEQRLQPSATTVGLSADLTNGVARPSGILLRGGALDRAPNRFRSSLLVDGSGALDVARVRLLATWQGSGPRRSFETLNERPPANGVALFTPSWGTTTPAVAGAHAVVLRSFGALAPGATATGEVIARTGGDPVAIPDGGAVLVARGIAAQYLSAEAPLGQTVTVRPVLSPTASGVSLAVGGGPELVRDGVAVFRPGDIFPAGYLADRSARAAIGQRDDGSLLLVAVDGGRPGYSAGMTSFELAQALVRLGARTAYALAGGDAATLAFDGGLLSRPSGAAEQPVADALLLSYSGVYVPPLPEGLVTATADLAQEQLAYRIVRPSQVSASLLAPDGSVLASQQQHLEPGAYSLAWNGQGPNGAPPAEGRYRFVVDATDDTGQHSSMEQDFSLDLTLPTLVPTVRTLVAPATPARQVATFTLTRQANVTATVVTAGGTVVRTLELGSLPAGPQPVYWDGRDDTGEVVYAGDYQLRVGAANDVGTVSLAVPLSVRATAETTRPG